MRDTGRVGKAQIGLGAAGFAGNNLNLTWPGSLMVVECFLLGNGHDSLRMNSMNVCVQCGCGKSNRRQLKDNEMMVPTWHEDLRREPYGLPLLP